MFTPMFNHKILKQFSNLHHLIRSTEKYSSLASSDIRSICSKLNNKSENVIFSFKDNGSLNIQLNNPKKRNAMNLGMYQNIGAALRIASDNEQIKCIIFKGKDGFYSSGNDLSYLKDIPENELQPFILKTINAMDDYINELIDIKKPIIAAVDGPAIGIGCSTLGLFDYIFASNRAEFWVPFSKIGLTTEGCSSYTFPRIIGLMRANKMLYFNYKLDSKTALKWGFISELIEGESIDFQKAIDKFENYLTCDCNIQSIIEGKKLVRNDEIRTKLKKINHSEGEIMKKLWQGNHYQNYLNNFYKK